MINHYINYPDTEVFAICYWTGSDRVMYRNRNYVPDGNVGQMIVLVRNATSSEALSKTVTNSDN